MGAGIKSWITGSEKYYIGPGTDQNTLVNLLSTTTTTIKCKNIKYIEYKEITRQVFKEKGCLFQGFL